MPLMHENRLKTLRPEKSSFLRLPYSSNLFFTLLLKCGERRNESRASTCNLHLKMGFRESASFASYCASLPGGICFVARFQKEVFVCQTKSACSLKRRLISARKKNSWRRRNLGRNMDRDKRERSSLEGLIRKLDREAEFGWNVYRVWWCLICYSCEAHI